MGLMLMASQSRAEAQPKRRVFKHQSALARVEKNALIPGLNVE